MCWYSADHAANIAQAEVGQRLVVRKVHGSNWAVSESDLHKDRPTPVCLLDNTRLLFRLSEVQQPTPVSDVDAVFRMLSKPKRDVLMCSDGREISFDSLPENVRFDVLMVPGQEQLSRSLEADREPEEVAKTRSKSLLARVF
jgi:hypothetical protein